MSRPSAPARILVAPIRFYQRFVSPFIPPSCRFTPSCSAYAVEALQVHGALLGSWLAVRRLLRCAPWHPGGWDPVPPPRSAEHPHPHPGTAGHPHPGTAGHPHPGPAGHPHPGTRTAPAEESQSC